MAERCEIVGFFNCKKCLEEIEEMSNKRELTAVREYGRISVGVTMDGFIQVWCERHQMSILKTEEEVELVN